MKQQQQQQQQQQQSNDVPLMSSYQNAIPLYDAEALLDVSPEVSQGYLILLSSYTNDDRTLSFASLIDGNVLDACFGTRSQRQDTTSPLWRHCRDAKIALSTAADSSPSFNKLAIETYVHAFTIVKNYHVAIHKMHCCIRCFRQGAKRSKAKQDLKDAFATLTIAVITAITA